MKRNQNGFSAVEALLILIIIGILGGVGYYVYKTQQETKKSQDNANKSSLELNTEPKQEPEKPAGETFNWLLYEAPGKEYTVRLPDGWKLHRYLKNPTLYSFDAAEAITYKKDTLARVEEEDGGKDFASTAFSLNFGKITGEPRGTLSKQLKTNQNLEVKHYIFEQTIEPDGLDIPKGSTEYRYDLSKGDSSVVIVHHVKPGETEQTARVEQLIKTLVIN